MLWTDLITRHDVLFKGIWISGTTTLRAAVSAFSIIVISRMICESSSHCPASQSAPFLLEELPIGLFRRAVGLRLWHGHLRAATAGPWSTHWIDLGSMDCCQLLKASEYSVRPLRPPP